MKMGNILQIYVYQTSLKHKLNSLHSELARTLVPVESTNNLKINRTHHWVIGDGCIWEEIALMKPCWASQCSFTF